MEDEFDSKRQNPIIIFFFITILIVVLPPYLLVISIIEIFFRAKFGLIAHHQGKFIVFVYSNSSKWKQYIEQNILPEIENYSIILNWSERKQWNNNSPAVQIFHHWAGQNDFNPIAIVFSNFFRVKTIRFYKAFQKFKHGKDHLLKKAENELFDLLKEKTK